MTSPSGRTKSPKSHCTRDSIASKSRGVGEMSPHQDLLSASQLSVGMADEQKLVESSQASLTQTQTQMELTQMECTQQSEMQLTPDEASNMTPLSPPPALPWARLVPCVPSQDSGPIDLKPGKAEYWLGRSTTKCDIAVPVGSSLIKKESTMMIWAHSMISNRHCRIAMLGSANPQTTSDANTQQPCQTPSSLSVQILLEDSSGNGTWVNETTCLRKGEQRLLHSGDEICLVNPQTVRKRISSARVAQSVIQQYTYIFVLTSKPKRPCVNPRAMNYLGVARDRPSFQATSPRSARRIEAHYDIREVLGDGTSGQVRRAINRQTGQEFAVKIISLRQQIDMTSMEHEVSMMQSLDHPYIVQLADVFVHRGIAMYLVMELVGGGDLFDRIVQHQRYTEVDARRVMRRLLSAVYYLHETKNIVHRDLKPENILCSSPTNVKLADFGLAKIMQSDGLKTFCGTPQYFAPEVLQRRLTVAGEGRYGKAADMWSLGVILFILLTGRPPFNADADPLAAYNSVDLEDNILNSMPSARQLVQQLLRMDPKRRLSVRQACDHPWIATEDGDTHCHPLDDPMVTARKRLFSESSECKHAKSSVANEDAEGVDDCGSETEVLSKADFSAAATSHRRENSDFRLDRSSQDERMDTVDEAKPKEESGKDSSVEEAKRVDKEALDRTSTATPSPGSVSEEAASRTGAGSALASRSTELSVTPSEYGEMEVPRSPLAAMNLNERSNRFREQVLRRQESQRSTPESRSPNESSNVTPTASNTRNVHQEPPRQAPSTLEEDREDPILSQFSSDPSSLASFPDSPIKARVSEGGNSVVTDKTNPPAVSGQKRPLEGDDETDHADDSHKRRNVKQTKQTTLRTWFALKKAAASHENQ